MMLSDQPHIAIEASYTTGEALLEGLETQQPDVLLIDILLPDYNGNDLAILVHKTYPEIKMVALTSLDTPAMVRSMMHNGCKAYLLKGTDKQSLITAIESAFEDKEYIEPGLAGNLLQYMLNPQKAKTSTTYRLTKREQEILILIAAGETTQQIADNLNISPRTAETHRLTLLKKLSARNTAELISNAFRHGLVE